MLITIKSNFMMHTDTHTNPNMLTYAPKNHSLKTHFPVKAKYSKPVLLLVVALHVALLISLLSAVHQAEVPVTNEVPMMVSLINEIPVAPIINQIEPQPPKPEVSKPKLQPVTKPIIKPLTKPIIKPVTKPVTKPEVEPKLDALVPQPLASEVPITAEAQPSDDNVALEAEPVTDTTPTETKATVAEQAASKLEVTEPPRFGVAYLNNPKPKYPSLSRRAGEEGRVLLRVLVNADGIPETVEISSTSKFERLDNAALVAVKQWRFVPAKKNNVPMSAYVTVPINFSLKS